MKEIFAAIVPTLILAGIFYFVYLTLRTKKTNMLISCPNCKYEGAGKHTTRGSFWIEIVLWLCFIVPGLIYSIWRLTTKGYVCPKCDYRYVARVGPTI